METEEMVEADPYDILDTGKWLPNCNKLTCELCDMKFSNKLKIVLHWCTAHGYKLCSICTNYAFKYDSDKIQHELQHIPFGCSSCSHEFTSINENNVIEHYKQVHQSFLCSFCSSVIQPFSKYPEHVEKKHSVTNCVEFSRSKNLYTLDNDEVEISRDSFFNCLMCNKRKKIDMLFGHYIFYHNISIHSLKKHLDKTPQISVTGTVLSGDCSTSEIEETENNLKDKCTVCENSYKFDEIAKELHNVFCQGYIVCNLKDCAKVFENENELIQHLDSVHASQSCKYGCKETILKNPQEANEHMQNLHDIIECFLCNIVNSSGNFKNHLRDKHSVNLSTYEKAMNIATSKLYRVENNSMEDADSKHVLCNFCDHDITKEIKEFSFISHYRNYHEVSTMEILRNLDKNPIIDVILNDKKTKIDEECLNNFQIIKSLDRLILSDFDTSKVFCIGVEHIEEKPVFENNDVIQKIMQCEFCQNSFDDKCVYYEHLKDYHGFKLINIDSCDKCKDQQNSETAVNEDNKNFNLSLICPLDESFHVTKDNFKNHLIFEHSENNLTSDSIFYKCYVCSFAYKSLKEVRNHFNTFHPDIKMNYCKLCRYKLSSTESTEHFARNHAEDLKRVEKFCCKLCKKEFKKMGTAKLHFAKSHRKKDLSKKRSSYKCQFSLCTQIFESKEDRKMHIIFAHPDEKMFACKTCPLKFSTKSSLSSHQTIHKNIVNTCEFCSKTFLRRDSFKEHLLIHSDVRLKCSFCDKVFVQRSNLVRHERIHLNEKPYLCSYCKKAFSDKGACTSHEKVHTKEESSNCEVCGKHFARKQKLKYHMRLHTLENVLTCECGKIFPESYSFRKHQESHQNKKRCLKCKFCDKTFRSAKTKEKHENAHNVEETSESNEDSNNSFSISDSNDLPPVNSNKNLVVTHGSMKQEGRDEETSHEFVLS